MPGITGVSELGSVVTAEICVLKLERCLRPLACSKGHIQQRNAFETRHLQCSRQGVDDLRNRAFDERLRRRSWDSRKRAVLGATEHLSAHGDQAGYQEREARHCLRSGGPARLCGSRAGCELVVQLEPE